MDTENLKTFLVLAELKNFTQTADQCFVAQSTVTNRIMDLEKEIGKVLFVRKKRGVELTEEGKYFLSYARRIVELENSAVSGLQHFPDYSCSLRIGSVNTVYDCHMLPVLSEYLKSHSQIAVKVIVDHSNVLYRMLQDGTLDVIFTFLGSKKKGCVSRLFKTDELVLVTGAANREFEKGIRREELCGIYYLYCDFVIQEGAVSIREIFPKNYPFPFEIDKSTKLLPYLLDGIGYTFLPRSFVKEYLDGGKLLEIPLLDFEAPEIKSYVMALEKRAKEKHVADFLDMV